MNDREIEQLLRQLPAPELPEAWRGEILAAARREARAGTTRCVEWPPLLLALHNLFARNPFSASALAALWLLILLFRFTTPVDLSEKEMLAHADLSKPVHLLTMAEEIRLAELAEDQPGQPQLVP